MAKVKWLFFMLLPLTPPSSKYHPVFVIDDSHSVCCFLFVFFSLVDVNFPQMAADGAWGKTKQAVVRVAAEAMQHDSEGIEMYFLNSSLYQNSITVRCSIHMDCRMLTEAIYQAPEDVVQTFDKIKPKGITLSLTIIPLSKFDVIGPSPIGARLEFVLNKIIDQLEQAKHDAAAYGQIKPINIVVLTNSPLSDNTTRVIRVATRKLNEGLHHPNAIAIQFTQIGNDKLARTALKKLSDDPSFVCNLICFCDHHLNYITLEHRGYGNVWEQIYSRESAKFGP